MNYTKTELTEMVITLSAENMQLRQQQIIQEKGSMQFTELLKTWIKHKEKRVRPDTYIGYANHVYNHLIPYFTEKKTCLRDIVPSVLEEYFDYKLECGLKIATIKHHYTTIKAALNFALRDGLITNNQYTVAKLPSSDDKYQYQTLSFCEINYLIKELMTTDIIVPVILSVILGMPSNRCGKRRNGGNGNGSQI